MGRMDLEDAAEQLYGLPPEQFIAVRDALARHVRTEGEPELARRVRSLRKPTRGSWLINLLAREQPSRVGALDTLAQALRQAHRSGEAPELLRLSGERTRTVAALTQAALDGGRAAGYSPREAIRAEITGTLTAALTDPEVAHLVAVGRVVSAASPASFGPLGLFEPIGSAEARPSPDPAGPATRTSARRDAERAADLARAAQTRAQAEVTASRLTLHAAEAELDAARGSVAELTADLRLAEQQVAASLGGLAEAEAMVNRAEEQAHRAAAEAAAAEATLNALTRD
jgi:hypothetical protein